MTGKTEKIPTARLAAMAINNFKICKKNLDTRRDKFFQIKNSFIIANITKHNIKISFIVTLNLNLLLEFVVFFLKIYFNIKIPPQLKI